MHIHRLPARDQQSTERPSVQPARAIDQMQEASAQDEGAAAPGRQLLSPNQIKGIIRDDQEFRALPKDSDGAIAVDSA